LCTTPAALPLVSDFCSCWTAVLVLFTCMMDADCCSLCCCCCFRENDAETNNKMRYDPVMLSLLLAMMCNVTSCADWESVLRNPVLDPLRGQYGAFSHLGKDGLPDEPARLQDARIIVSSCLHAAGYPGCTGHGEFGAI
jgi:hypothetical protein